LPASGNKRGGNRSDEELANHKNLKLLGKADTNWRQEGAFQAMSGFLSHAESA
jgi:hypothetical protein